MTATPARTREVWNAAEVAAAFRVDPQTVGRWAQQGRFPKDSIFRTLGGERRFYADLIRPLLAAGGPS
jgi:hypothetical protein